MSLVRYSRVSLLVDPLVCSCQLEVRERIMGGMLSNCNAVLLLLRAYSRPYDEATRNLSNSLRVNTKVEYAH